MGRLRPLALGSLSRRGGGASLLWIRLQCLDLFEILVVPELFVPGENPLCEIHVLLTLLSPYYAGEILKFAWKLRASAEKHHF